MRSAMNQKHISFILGVALSLTTAFMISACSHGGSSNSASPTVTAQSCGVGQIYSSYTNSCLIECSGMPGWGWDPAENRCVQGTIASNVPIGEWKYYVTVTDVSVYENFLKAKRVCRHNCSNYVARNQSTLIYLDVRTQQNSYSNTAFRFGYGNNNIVPAVLGWPGTTAANSQSAAYYPGMNSAQGRWTATILTYQGRPAFNLSKSAPTQAINGSAGFEIGDGSSFGYHHNNDVTTLSATYSDTTNYSALNVTLSFNGQVFAQGTLNRQL